MCSRYRPRYVISVTKNEAKNEAGYNLNRIASHFNRSARTFSCNLVNLKNDLSHFKCCCCHLETEAGK